MSVFWATQYRPDDVAGRVAGFGEVAEMFAGIGATRTTMLVAMTQDVGSIAIVTNWESLGRAAAVFDPVDGAAYQAISASPTLSAQLASSGTPVRRVTGSIDLKFGDTDAGKFVVNVTQSTSAGPELWAEAGELAWEALRGQGALGMEVARVLTGDATGLSIASVTVDDVNQFFGVFTNMPPRLLEIFAGTNTTTVLRNVHRVIRA